MIEEQEKRFDEWFGDKNVHTAWRSDAKIAWQACLDANHIVDGNKKGNTVTIDLDELDWPERALGVVCYFANESANEHADQENCIQYNSRPAPAWMPKDNEPVLFRDLDDNRAKSAFYLDGLLYFGDLTINARLADMIPFDKSKVFKPWDEI